MNTEMEEHSGQHGEKDLQRKGGCICKMKTNASSGGVGGSYSKIAALISFTLLSI